MARAAVARGVLLSLLLLAGAAAAAAPKRVVSLVPSLTETVAALGAGDRLVGRSRYCLHPTSVRTLPEVGGYLDPSWERIVALKPDLVLLTPESRETERRLRSLGLPVLALPQNRLEEALDGMVALGRALGLPERGRALADSLRRGIDALGRAARAARADAPRVLVVADRLPEPGPPRDLWVIGRGSWLSDLLEALGARNAAADVGPAQPLVSREGVLALDPDWILELWPVPPAGRSARDLEGDWRAWPELHAVRADRVRALTQDCLSLPGPRLLEAARLLDRTLAPAAPGGGGAR